MHKLLIRNRRCRAYNSLLPRDDMQLAKAPQPVTGPPPLWAMNSLLADLPPDELHRLSVELTWRPLKVRQVLHKHGEPISEVYFPGRSVCSITNMMEDGGVVEVATVGREGLVGVGAILGNPIATGEAFVQIPGELAAVMSIDTFRRELDRRGPFYEHVTRYSQAFVSLLMQSVACNGLHSAEERCCRWLLMTHDRIGQDEFPLTHEFLAIMLGVRRPTVTLVMAELARLGIVSHVRGHVRIVDRNGLEAASCECYRNVRLLFERLLPSKSECNGLSVAQ
jgi:CRP-like cAMP-binding protein